MCCCFRDSGGKPLQVKSWTELIVHVSCLCEWFRLWCRIRLRKMDLIKFNSVTVELNCLLKFEFEAYWRWSGLVRSRALL